MFLLYKKYDRVYTPGLIQKWNKKNPECLYTCSATLLLSCRNSN